MKQVQHQCHSVYLRNTKVFHGTYCKNYGRESGNCNCVLLETLRSATLAKIFFVKSSYFASQVLLAVCYCHVTYMDNELHNLCYQVKSSSFPEL